MGLSRKNRAKLNYLSSDEYTRRVMDKHGFLIDQLSDTALPDDYEFEGWKVVNGKFYKTAGEYKEACKKLYG